MDHSGQDEKPYHHGDLRRAILDAAEQRLVLDGPDAVTIRACARDAGVSPAAPLHHFGSLKGLLSALAVRGFERLVARLDADTSVLAGAGGAPALVGAYVSFAVSSPKMFDLMWRDDVLDEENPFLVAARRQALERLQRFSTSTAQGVGLHQTIRNWSLAHGLATLLLHGRVVSALANPAAGLETIDDFVALAYSPAFTGP